MSSYPNLISISSIWYKFSFFKHLDKNLIKEYENDSASNTVSFDEVKKYKSESDTDSEDDSNSELDLEQPTYDHKETLETVDSKTFYRDHTSVICDNYKVDCKPTTVAHRLATIIVSVKISTEQVYPGWCSSWIFTLNLGSGLQFCLW